MNRKLFEKIISDKFEEYNPSYEAKDDMWESIEAELLPKRDSKRVLKFVLFLFLSFGFGWSYWSATKQDPSLISTPVEVTSNSFLEEDTGHIYPENRDVKIDDIEYKSVSKSFRKADHISRHSNTQSVALQINSPSFKQESILALSNAISLEENYSNEFSANKLANIGASANFTESDFNKSTGLKERGSVQKQAKDISASPIPIPILQLLPIKVAHELYTNNDMPLQVFKYSELGKLEIDINSKDRFTVGIVGGMHSLKSNYKLINESYASILEQRVSSEEAELQYSLGLQIEYDLNSKWSIQSGLNFYHFQEASFRTTTISQLDTLNDYTQIGKTVAGADSTLIGTAYITKTTNHKELRYTNRQWLTIPIILNYNLSLSEKSKLGIGIGIEKIIYTRIQGYEDDLNDLSYNLSLDNESRYGARGMHALLRFRYKYVFTDKWSIQLESNYKHALISNYKPIAPIQKSFHTISLAIGTHLKF